MKKKIISIALVCLVALGIPAYAVFNEKDISHTLSVLRFELKQQNDKMENLRSRISQRNSMQHGQMVRMIKKCNELSLILYSQNQDYTFDVTYALSEVTDQYQAFSKRRMPYDDIVNRMNLEIERYERLIESLRRIPPVLDEVEEVPDSISISKAELQQDFATTGMPRPRPVDRQHGEHQKVDHKAAQASRAEVQLPSISSSIQALKAELQEEEKVDNGKMGNPEDRRPFVLDEEGQVDRDSCMYYARNLLKMYTEFRDKIIEDNEHYAELSQRLEEAYNYAQDRYSLIQKRIFVEGQDDYFSVLKKFRRYSQQAIQDAAMKYSSAIVCTDESHHHKHNESEWRGPVVSGFILFIAGYLLLSFALSTLIVILLTKYVKKLNTKQYRKRRFGMSLLLGILIFTISIMIAKSTLNHNFFQAASRLLLVYAWLLAAIVLSLIIRVKPEHLNSNLRLYTPIIVMGLIVITFRIIFIPNKLVNLIYPPLLLIFAIWQFWLCRKHRRKIANSDKVYSWISFVVFAGCAVLSWAGYVLLSIQIFIWWLFQVAAIATITALYDLLSMYEEKIIAKRKDLYKKEHKVLPEEKDGAYIEVTWIFDLIKQAVMPILAILTLPFCLYKAADVFDLAEICKTFFYKPFFNLSDASGNPILHLSLYKLVLVVCLFYLFKYASYVIKAFYRHVKLQNAMSKNKGDFVHANQVNLTLANNLFSILIWGIYAAAAIVLLKIPMGALSIIAAGLATGVGLALKDVLNNFIYGIQLMTGRLRVGDYIECDGVRGQVESITYQSTQVATLEGDIMAFTNTTLFNKNFRNLTKDNPYAFVKVSVGVNYGADVEEVRQVILKALEPMLEERDRFGRRLVEKKFGIQVFFDSFGDNSVNIAIKQFLLVEGQNAVIARIKETVYNALGEAGINIPFPQHDVYIKEMPKLMAKNEEK